MGHLLNMAIRASQLPNIDVNWSHGYLSSCATRTFEVYLNGTLIASGSGSTTQTGSFKALYGDTIRIDSISGASGTACSGAQAYVKKDSTTVASQVVTGIPSTASASYVIDSWQAVWNLQSGDVTGPL